MSFLLILGSYGFGHAGLNDGLMVHYPFNGNANDESGSGNHGTVYGATPTEDRFGNPNSAYYFDGIDNYIEAAPIGTHGNDSFTVSYWMNFQWQDHRIWTLYFGSSNYCGNNGFHSIINVKNEWGLNQGDVQNGIFCGIQNQFNVADYQGSGLMLQLPTMLTTGV
jgi:hypothetical protein